MSYTLTVTLDATPDEAEERVRAALAEQGFGILTEIDVEATLREKIGEDVGPYRILGACNPPLAHRGITTDDDLGALLPCNVVVRANDAGGTDIVAADPLAMLGVAGDEVADLANEARERIEKALASLTSAG